MKLVLMGCGQMGRGAAYALARDPRVSCLTLIDRDGGRADGLARWLEPHGDCRILVTDDVADALADSDAVAVALPWAGTRSAIDAAAAAGIPIASITRPPAAQLSELDAVATAAGIPVLLPIGLEPGLTELFALDVARGLGEVAALEIRCGGIPATPRPPWGYTAFFGGEQANHLPIAQRRSLAIKDGRTVSQLRFSGLETRDVPGVGRLEGYHDGMVPWLARHPALAAADCTQKTLRWPGFAGAVTELADLGLLDETPVVVDGVSVSPLRVVENVLAPRLRAGSEDEDIVVLEVTGHGRADTDGRAATASALLVDRFDRSTGLSAMTRTTGFTLASATAMLAEGTVSATGWLRPHEALSATHFTRMKADLAALGVRWTTTAEDPAAASPPSSVTTGGTPA
ncbi:saccharopine dehydrogenase family protein [Nocardia terpenica]|uniref:Saccharopine dehydrogenase n=2 Tax=Nocardia terpenica TaxID=455432 RepID=A0A0U1YZC9_9NOCA|nr:saccharopine dehydrogenase C-terminal domain-containing protein [Nocardia terpenica]AJO72764.1 Saccharopine dehydrogenase [Nocardia terpenica]BBE00863.1 putative dehydrogenase [Nocardia terpenica]